jgi:hypothetical protein
MRLTASILLLLFSLPVSVSATKVKVLDGDGSMKKIQEIPPRNRPRRLQSGEGGHSFFLPFSLEMWGFHFL